jgi:hypothetical protein
VLDEGFNGHRTALQLGTGPFNGGTYRESLSAGQYQFSVDGIGADVGLWSRATTGELGSEWSVATSVSSPSGHCGVVAGDGTTFVMATLDPTTSTGQLSWYAKRAGSSTFPRVGRTSFPVPAGSTGSLALVADHGEVTVLLGATRLATARDDQLGPPTSAGVAAVGSTTACSFDALQVRKGD